MEIYRFFYVLSNRVGFHLQRRKIDYDSVTNGGLNPPPPPHHERPLPHPNTRPEDGVLEVTGPKRRQLTQYTVFVTRERDAARP